MYRIMIVDDDIWVRRGLKEQIDWNNLQAELIGEASDGEEAHKLALKIKPDIILTDIKMPHMNGIELMELINKDVPDARVIVISGYSEFELVQKAMVNKAINYILKPIDEKNLNLSISIAIKEIEQSRVEKSEKQSLKLALSRSLPALKEKYLNMLISGDKISNSDFQKYISDLKIKFESNWFQAGSVNICNYTDMLKKHFENNINLLNLSMDNIICESNGYGRNIISSKNKDDNKEYIILLGGYQMENPKKINRDVLNFFIKITDDLKARYSMEVCIGIGRWYEGIERIPNSYNEAIHATKILKVQSQTGILFFDEISKKNVNEDVIENVTKYILNHFNDQITLESVSEMFFLNPSYFSRIFKSKTGENFIDYVTRVRIEKAICLMRNPDLKINDIAEMVGYFNTNYFSKLFRKIVGCSPTEYRKKI